MTCRPPFARKKSQAPRQARRKTRKLAVRTSSRAVSKLDDDENRGISPTTVFHEFAIPADTSGFSCGIVEDVHGFEGFGGTQIFVNGLIAHLKAP